MTSKNGKTCNERVLEFGRRIMYSKNTDYMLNYLTLRISDNEIRDSMTKANSHLSHKLYKPLASMNGFSCILYTSNYLFGEGDLYIPFINWLTLFVILLNPVFYRYKMEWCKWCSPLYLLVHTICTPLLFFGLMGPFNSEKLVNYQNNLLVNFLIAVMVEGNDIQTITVNCFQFLLASVLVCQAECISPYPEIETLVEEDQSCFNWILSRVYRQYVIAMVVFFSNYVKHLVYSGLYIEKERMKRQKVQLNRYFMSQKNGIVVMKDKCSVEEVNKLLFCNKSFQTLTGLDSEKEAAFFAQRRFQISQQIKEGVEDNEDEDEDSLLLTEQRVSLWDIYEILLSRHASTGEQEPLTVTVFVESPEEVMVQSIKSEDSVKVHPEPEIATLPKGKVVTLQVSIEPLIFEMQECNVLTFVDMTHLRRLVQAEQENLKFQIRESTVSHELMAPLKCIVRLSEDMISAPNERFKQMYINENP